MTKPGHPLYSTFQVQLVNNCRTSARVSAVEALSRPRKETLCSRPPLPSSTRASSSQEPREKTTATYDPHYRSNRIWDTNRVPPSKRRPTYCTCSPSTTPSYGRISWKNPPGKVKQKQKKGEKQPISHRRRLAPPTTSPPVPTEGATKRTASSLPYRQPAGRLAREGTTSGESRAKTLGPSGYWTLSSLLTIPPSSSSTAPLPPPSPSPPSSGPTSLVAAPAA